MRYIVLILILVSLASCRTQKTAVSSRVHVECKKDSTFKLDSAATTEIMWSFSSDTLFVDNNPSFFNLVRITDDGKKSMTIPKDGYIKVTTTTSSSSTASKSSISDTTKAKKQESTKHTIIYKNNWFLTATLSVLTFIFCQCWQYRKKIAKIFARLK